MVLAEERLNIVQDDWAEPWAQVEVPKLSHQSQLLLHGQALEFPGDVIVVILDPACNRLKISKNDLKSMGAFMSIPLNISVLILF